MRVIHVAKENAICFYLPDNHLYFMLNKEFSN